MKDLVANQQVFFYSGQTKNISFRKEQLIKLRSALVNNEQLLVDCQVSLGCL
jgi:hypothetical protein